MKKKKKIEFLISISSSPGKFGETVHNASFQFHKISYLYKALKIKNLNSAIKSIKDLKIKGASVSMPFKEKVISFLDKVEPMAKKAGAVNTILNKKGYLVGYNTDIYGAYKALSYLYLKPSDSVLILGAGGVARAIIIALKKMKINDITIANRHAGRSKKLAKNLFCKHINWKDRNNTNKILLINATSLGMNNSDELPLNKSSLFNFNKVMDVVVKNKDTKLIKETKYKNLLYVSGIVMTFYQAAEQYKIYTGYRAPLKEMLKAYNKVNNLTLNLKGNSFKK